MLNLVVDFRYVVDSFDITIVTNPYDLLYVYYDGQDQVVPYSNVQSLDHRTRIYNIQK
ncbi:MAG: hypothetical protein INQ03_12495 [Candidatus Heimdallarchaeota archaeon]|nr:hypothetical protein [Candidatus Heimdallarchaeota archaeon]